MSNLFFSIFLFSIWNVIMFYHKNLGISVLLFLIPFLLFWYRMLKKNQKIQNCKGFILMIPILVLASTYLIYDNLFFKCMNVIIIPILFTIMNICILGKTNNASKIVKTFFLFLLKPFLYFPNMMQEVEKYIKNKCKILNHPKISKIMKSMILILPLLLLVLFLLISADLVFKSIFNSLLDTCLNIIYPKFLDNLYGKMIHFILFYIYVSSTIYYILFSDLDKKEKDTKKETVKEKDTILTLLVCLNFIYIIFDIIQIKSLIFHSIDSSIHYAEYARQGFFQLMFVSIINITILLISKRYKDKENKKDNRFINWMSMLMIILTFIIIISSFLRMNLYEAQYGYTLLRLLVYIILCTEIILLFPTIFYIFNPEIPIIKHYFIVISTVYTLINFINVDKMIAQRNIERYKKKGNIDIVYLENGSADNVKYLFAFYESIEEKEIKESLEKYFSHLTFDMDAMQEFNISKWKSKKILNKYKKGRVSNNKK